MKIRSALLFSIFLMFFTCTFAQQNDETRRDCVTEEGKRLNFLVGVWKVKSKSRAAGAKEKWEEVIGSSKINFLFNQCLLAEKLSIEREGRPLDIFALYAYNNISKKYQWAFAHSEHGMLSFYEGPLAENKFTFRYKFEIGDRKMLFKRELTRLSRGFEMVAWRSNDDGKNWRAESYLTYYQ